MLRILTAASALALLSACATTDNEPIDASAFVAATPVEDRADYPVEIVETAVALPLPGQMMPVGARVTTNPDGSVTRTYTRTVSAPSVSPAEAIRQGRTSALIEPSVDGYVNAIQVYPYTEGALYRLYASPGQVSDIALQPGEAARPDTYLFSQRRDTKPDPWPQELPTVPDAQVVLDVGHKVEWGWPVALYLLTKSIAAGGAVLAPFVGLFGLGGFGANWLPELLALVFTFVTLFLLVEDLARI